MMWASLQSAAALVPHNWEFKPQDRRTNLDPLRHDIQTEGVNLGVE